HTLYGLPVVINRLSTIYGPHQHGAKGYGWVHWFTKAARYDLPLTVYGDGKQVRDVLHVDDLCRLLLKQIENIDEHAGEIYNVGGGVANSISILELLDILAQIKDKGLAHSVTFKDWRPADFRVYISNITKVRKKADWYPEISVKEGVEKLWKEC
ncbi:MAG: GDP-mannose 4,6-dehydratase, partial [Chloroflexi bacterium]|nr:GDP-mannose 4,6-dehydratase [Chloroflexota bacterium]